MSRRLPVLRGERPADLTSEKRQPARPRALALQLRLPQLQRHRLSAEIRRLDWIETAGSWARCCWNRAGEGGGPLHNAMLRRPPEPIACCGCRRSRCSEFLSSTRSMGRARPARRALRTLRLAARRARPPRVDRGRRGRPAGGCWVGERGGPCFARQIRKCRGASWARSPRRRTTCASPRRSRRSAFPTGPSGSRGDRRARRHARIEEAHVIDRWRHLGTARDDDELRALAATAGCRSSTRTSSSSCAALVRGASGPDPPDSGDARRGPLAGVKREGRLPRLFR